MGAERDALVRDRTVLEEDLNALVKENQVGHRVHAGRRHDLA